MEMRRFIYVPLSMLLLGLMFGVDSARAAAGALDPTFGAGGKVLTRFGPSNAAVAQDAVLQSDGKIVVLVGFFNDSEFGLVRYLSNGKLDTSFGNGGSVMTQFPNNLAGSPTSIALQPDGKIVAAGGASSADGTVSEFALARYDTNGTLDTTFGSGGLVFTNFVGVMLGGVRNLATAVLIQPDGKILAGGLASENAKRPTIAALARYHSNGSLDASFGGGSGMVTVSSLPSVVLLAVLTSGDIFTVNGMGTTAQFNPWGGLESRVRPGTIAASSHGGIFAFDGDSSFVEAGQARDPNGTRFDADVKVLRFDATGTLDETFNSPIFDFGAEDRQNNAPQAVAIQTDGKIVLGGVSGTVTPLFGLARLNTDGTLDSSFAAGGKLTTRFQGADQVQALVIQTDGKIVAIGQTFNGTTGEADLALARYLVQ